MPLQADIDVNQEWLESAMATDAELCECLFEQHNDSDEQPNTDNNVQPILLIPRTLLLMLNLPLVLLWTILIQKPLLQLLIPSLILLWTTQIVY